MPPKPLELTPEDLAKVEKARQRREGAKVDPEWQFVAEFGYYFGWGGVEAIMSNAIDIDQAQKLLAGARKVWYSKTIDTAVGTHVAVGAANSKNPRSVMKKGLEQFTKEVKA